MATPAKGKTPKCKACGEWVDKTLEHEYQNRRYFHMDCYNAVATESQHYKELIDYICQLYKTKAPTGWMTKQIKKFKEQDGYTYKGIEYTLRYIVEVERKDLLDASEAGIGIVSFYYLKARKYYIDRDARIENAHHIEINNIPEIIMIKRSNQTGRPKKINIEDI